MKLRSLALLLVAATGLAAALPAAAANCPTLLDHSFQRLQDSAPQSLCQYQGKVLLVVNTASFCGFTGQYEALEAVYDKYKGRGEPVHLIGVEFSKASRNIVGFEVLTLAPGGAA